MVDDEVCFFDDVELVLLVDVTFDVVADDGETMVVVVVGLPFLVVANFFADFSLTMFERHLYI